MAPKRSRDSDEPEQGTSSHAEDSGDNRDAYRETGSSPSKFKRLRHASFPQTPNPRSGKTLSTFTTPNKTPFTPYPLRASDSPSNPFGRKCVQSLIRSLPPPTSFSKHLALRFQFVRKGISPRNGGVYRVVQLPLSYTFVHLRCLIAFLFGVKVREGGNAKGGSSGKARMFSRLAGLDDDGDHLFEVKKDVKLYNARYKPGEIKTGYTWAKLSSTRDPCRWREEEDEIDDEETPLDGSSGSQETKVEEDEDWEWKDEEEFTVGHAWPDGLNTERGIIYYHSRTVQIHISVNQTSVSRRRGRGNAPYVFMARGRVHLSPPPLPQPLFNSPPLKVASRTPSTTGHGPLPSGSKVPLPDQELTDWDADGDIDPECDTKHDLDENHPFNEHREASFRDIDDDSDDCEDDDEEEDEDDQDDDDDDYEDTTVDLKPRKWNEPENAFATYLKRYMGPSNESEKPFTLFDDDEEEEHLDGHEEDNDETECGDGSFLATPGLSLSAYSSPCSPPISSSPAVALSSSPQKPYDHRVRIALGGCSPRSSPIRGDSGLSSVLLPFPSMKYKQTPAPPRARVHRMRIERLERRIEKSKKGKILRLKVEDEDEAQVRPQGEEDEDEDEEEVDQLDDDEDGEGEEEEEDDDDGRWVRPALKEGEVWDPFGDEVEV